MTADIRVSGTDQYRRKAEGNPVDGERWFFPEECSAFSISLDAIYKLAYGRGESGLRNDAEEAASIPATAFSSAN